MSEEIKLTPEEIEKEMIQRELRTQNALDVNAQFFYLYIHRLNEQIKFMSKKQLIRLIKNIVSSDLNKPEDVSRALKIADKLNLNSIKRTFDNVLKQHMEIDREDIKQFSDNEKEFFKLLDELIANKYVTSILQMKPDAEVKTIEDIVKTPEETKAFLKKKKTEKFEKDAFATANQLLYTKMILVQHTLIEYLNNEEKKEKDNVG